MVLFMEVTDKESGQPKIIGLPHVAMIQPWIGGGANDEKSALIHLAGDHVPDRQIVTKETFAEVRRALGVAGR